MAEFEELPEGDDDGYSADENSMNDMVDMGDFDLPSVSENTEDLAEIHDDFGGKTVAFKFGFLGCGQGGGNVVGSFYKLGYRRAAVVNMSAQDMQGLPAGLNTLNLTGNQLGGAGKDPLIAAASSSAKRDEIFDLLTRSWGSELDYGLVCVGLGGGTGTGCAMTAVEVAKEYMRSIGKEPKVGAIVSLPSVVEGDRVAANAVTGFKQLLGADLSPLIVIDNQRIKELYKPSVSKLWEMCDSVVTMNLHWFNQLASQRGQLATFDKQDMASILDSGVVTYGSSAIGDLKTKDAIAAGIKLQLEASALAQMDWKKGTAAGLVLVGSNEILDRLPMDTLEYAYSALGRALAKGSVLHRGIYRGSRQELRAFTMIGGLQPPLARLGELAAAGRMPISGSGATSIGKFMGIN